MKISTGSMIRLFILFAILTVYSCTKDFEFDNLTTDNLTGEWAFPLIKSTVTLDDLITDTAGVINTGDDGLITLIYEADNLISMDGSERTIIPNQNKVLDESFEIPTATYNLGGEVPLSFDFVFEMVDEDHRIDTMHLLSGSYNMGIRTNLNKDDADITLTATNFIHQVTGQPLQVNLVLNNPSGNELYVSAAVDLTDYYVQFDNQEQYNTVYIDALVSFEADENPNLSPYYFQLENTFQDIWFSKFIGFIGENEETYADTIGISIFNSTDFSSISFGPGSVRLNMEVYNSLGLPIKLEINKFTAYNTVNVEDSIELEFNPSIIEINYPELDQFNEYVPTAINTEFIDINEMLDISPDRLFINVIGYLNQDAPADAVNYFANNSNLYVDAAIEVDLFAGISAFQVADTLAFDPASFESVQAMEFMVEVINGFPINGSVQLDFVNENYDVMYTLFEEGEELVSAGIVGPEPEYKVISPTSKKSFVLLERDALDLIEQASYIVFRSMLSTDDNQYVKIYSGYGMDLNLGAKVVYNY